MKIIKLTRGMEAFVDDQDFERVNQFCWQAQLKGRSWLVKRGKYNPLTQNNESEPLSVFILGLPKGTVIDHEDGNPFDNRRKNLRPCTRGQNNRAKRKKSPGKTSQFRGVSWHKGFLKWKASIEVSGKTFYLGLFVSEEAAARAYDRAATHHFGNFAAPNFTTQK